MGYMKSIYHHFEIIFLFDIFLFFSIFLSKSSQIETRFLIFYRSIIYVFLIDDQIIDIQILYILMIFKFI